MALWSLSFFLVLSCSNGNSAKQEKEPDNIALAINEVEAMKNCRLKAENRNFYLHKHYYEKRMKKYEGGISHLSTEDQKRIILAQSEYAFQLSDYLQQIGKQIEAQKVIHDLSTNTTLNLHTDTAQWLNFLYHQGKVLFRPFYISKNRKQLEQGYDCLIECYILASKRGYKEYEALALQSLSRYLVKDSIFALAQEYDAASLRYINEDGVSDSLLAINLAERAADIMMQSNNAYFAADAWRNLASCYVDKGMPEEAINCLNIALANPATEQYPDLMASINEQLSLSYAALDNKHNSDYYRNIYLDLQDSTRQDRQLEARVVALQEATTRIWIYVAWAFAIFLILCVATFILSRLRKRKAKKNDSYQEEIEEMEEELSQIRLQYSNAQRSAVEQRARISIIYGMIPLIDRMKTSIRRGVTLPKDNEGYAQCLDYATELSSEIDNQNAMITQWIKMRQGSIAPKIETIAMQDIFNIVEKNTRVLSQSGITLNVSPTSAKVKADSILTLFLINTLMDNARKATSDGGMITIDCTTNETGKYAEISVSDNGKGMTQEQLQKVVNPIECSAETIIKNHDKRTASDQGFGIVNCRGIINRYRKMAGIFSVCDFSATSELGKGTRISFRLPLVARLFVVAITFFSTLLTTPLHASNNVEAGRLADSLYNCNIEGRYADALLFADSCHSIVMNDSTIDINIKLSLFNETAVAALAMHQWEKYRYNNYRYTMLYKQATADTSLATYCQTMERNELIANIAMVVMLVLIISLIPIFWFIYLRHVLRYRKNISKRKQDLSEEIRLAKKEFDRLHIINNITDNQLSTLKHETMYYPARIRQQIETGCDIEDIAHTVSYYGELYNMLSTKAMGNQINAFTFPVSACRISDVIPNIEGTDSINSKVNDHSETISIGNITIITNRELMTYLNVLLKRHNGGKVPFATAQLDKEGYVNINFTLSNASLTEEETLRLFTPNTPNVDFLVMRQILREIGNSTLRYVSGITATYNNGNAIITITLPR